jgi:hypothetical protein
MLESGDCFVMLLMKVMKVSMPSTFFKIACCLIEDSVVAKETTTATPWSRYLLPLL